MQIFSTIAEARALVCARTTRAVLVPTMGALHRGHIALIRQAREVAGPRGEVAVSIFVNPLQFGPEPDLAKYPRPESEDEAICRREGVDLIFRPAVNEMYAPDRSVFVEETALADTLCGRSRPGHFRGVCTVVAKLFNVLAPDAAVFGEKDFQQLAIIRRLVRDLDFPIEIVAAPIVREPDGLACSSRNQYLSDGERAQAPAIRAALMEAANARTVGEHSSERLLQIVRDRIAQATVARIDYAEVVDADDLQPVPEARTNALLAVAVFFGQTRLIDNILLR